MDQDPEKVLQRAAVGETVKRPEIQPDEKLGYLADQ
jgi:hypothetical protein